MTMPSLTTIIVATALGGFFILGLLAAFGRVPAWTPAVPWLIFMAWVLRNYLRK